MAALSLNRIRAEGRVVLGFAADEGVTRWPAWARAAAIASSFRCRAGLSRP